jgi:predicted nucleic acid-binding Zn ribbon protein
MASKGLYRKREFFCPLLNLVVDENKVIRENGLFFYPTGGNLALCELRQEGTTEMLLVNPNAKVLTSSDGMLYTDPIRFEKVSLKFATSTKKVYLKKAQVKNVTGGGQEKYVDVYVTPMANANIRKENLLYSALPSILLAQTLEKAGFKVRINKVIMNGGGENTLLYSYVIKDYGEPVNYQRVAIDAADPRIFRFEDFRKSGALGRAMLDIDYGGGYGRALDENNSDLVMNDYKHWLNKEIKRGGGRKIFNKNLNLHLMGTIDKSNDSHDVQMQRVTAKFKEMLDRVAIEFSGSEQAVKDAIERDSGVMTKAEIIRNFETSLRKTQPRQPIDRDLQLPDSEFQQKLTNYTNNLTKFNQIRPTL